MKKLKILIISNSYIVTSGLQAVLNEITEVKYSSIEANSNNAINSLSSYSPKIVIYNTGVNKNIDEYLEINKIINVGIGYSNSINNKYYINLLNDDKSTIISLVRKIITDNFNRKIQEKDYELSSREITIVKFIAQGFTNQEIADELFLSKHTVITHRKNITNKLSIKTVSGLTVYAILNNIIDIKDVK